MESKKANEVCIHLEALEMVPSIVDSVSSIEELINDILVTLLTYDDGSLYGDEIARAVNDIQAGCSEFICFVRDLVTYNVEKARKLAGRDYYDSPVGVNNQ